MQDPLSNPHVLSHKSRLAAADGPVGSVADAQHALAGFLANAGPVQVFQALIQMLPHVAVFAVDADRNLLCWSDKAEQLLGFRREDVLGRYCLTANRCHQCMLGCGISEYGVVTDVPLVLLDRDGEPVRVRKTARAFFDCQRRFIGGIELLVEDEPAAERVASHRDDRRDRAEPDRADHPAAAGSMRTARSTPPAPGEAVLRQLPSPRTLSDAELKSKVHEALLRADGHIGRAAALLGVSRPTLWRWRRKLSIDV